MDIIDLFSNSENLGKNERVRNIVTLYALNRDIHIMGNMTFPLEDKMDILFEKDNTISPDEEILKNFPIEKLLVISLPIYKKLKSGDYEINIKNFEFKNDDEDVKDGDSIVNEISKNLTVKFIETFEKELLNIEDIKDEKLKNFKNFKRIDILENNMKDAIKKENYEKAAEIRDEIKKLK